MIRCLLAKLSCERYPATQIRIDSATSANSNLHKITRQINTVIIVNTHIPGKKNKWQLDLPKNGRCDTCDSLIIIYQSLSHHLTII
jgi:predicted transglutaminase-like cysteine proteinase